MEMSAGEIRRSYETAKNKRQQIAILADLNDCSCSVIEDIVNARKCEETVQEEVVAEKPVDGKDKILSLLFSRMDELDQQIKSLEEEYRRVSIAVEVIGAIKRSDVNADG